MTMLDPLEAARLEGSRRRAIRVLSAVLAASTLFCGYIGLSMLSPTPRSRSLGRLADFPPGVTVNRYVAKLNVSDTILNRPVASDDPLYVTRRPDGSLQVLLAWDSQSGCIVNPVGAEFHDPCSNHVYDHEGYLISEQRRLRLGALPVRVEGDEVLIDDALLPAER